ncbi:MAG TPA: MBL fold metallo-hydrolase [Thermoplasmata archaeon]|nr:MBL fold metallo-hydrolase [Thermoplasmata archaeon]
MAALSFYGGVGEIGGNTILLDSDGLRIMLDFGVSFTRQGAFFGEFLQVRNRTHLRDSILLGLIPPLDGLYRNDLESPNGLESLQVYREHPELWQTRVVPWAESEERIDALLLTHGHLDHVQNIPLIDPHIPIYCSGDTRILLETMEDMSQGVSSEFVHTKVWGLKTTKSGKFPGSPRIGEIENLDRDFQTFRPPAKFHIEDIEVEAYPVDHSVPGAVGFIIRTGEENIAYTGDFRFHGDHAHWTMRFFEAVAEDVDVLISEGTRMNDPEKDNEQYVRDRTTELIEQTNGLVMLGYSWKDLMRTKSMLEVSRRTGRELVISPRTAYFLHKMGSHVEAIVGLRVYLPRKGSMIYTPSDYVNDKYLAGYSLNWKNEKPDMTHLNDGIRAYHIARNPGRYLLHLDHHSFNELLDLGRLEGSIYIKVQSEPLTEEMHLSEHLIANWFRAWGINAPDHVPIDIPASGHACGPEINDVISVISPKLLIPLHTEHPELFPKTVRIHNPEIGVRYDLRDLL